MTRGRGPRPRVPRVLPGCALAGTLAGAFAVSCNDPVSAREIAGSRSQAVTVALGAEFDVRLGTVGPGEYASPPAISAPAVASYLGVEDDGPNVPAGPRQRFRFRATARGTTLVVFHHTGTNPTITDTVEVR